MLTSSQSSQQFNKMSFIPVILRDLFWTDPYFRAAWGDDDFEELRRKRLRDHQLLLDKFGKEIGQPTRCDNCIKGGEAEPKIEEPSDKPKDGEDKNELDEDTKEMDIAIKEDDLWPLFLPLSFFMGPALGLPQDSASQLLRVVEDDTKFEVSLDTHEYRPDELKINIDNNILTIEGKHEEKSDDGDSHVAKHFFKRYTLPAGCQAETVNSNLSSDGVLMIKAPKNPELLHNERAVPIELKKEDVAIKLKKEDAAIELKKEDGAEVVVKKND